MRKENGRIKGQVTHNLKEACELVEAGFEVCHRHGQLQDLPQTKVDKLIEK
ncbi:MAG: hypothetical protein ACETVM_04195 [Candidatus Bathyarchaeia archaeon]